MLEIDSLSFPQNLEFIDLKEFSVVTEMLHHTITWSRIYVIGCALYARFIGIV